WRGESSR
ncbi:lysis S family protein, partial [Escherichia coli 96.0107]